MLPILAYLVWWCCCIGVSGAPVTPLLIQAASCGPTILEPGISHSDVFRITIGADVNREWLRMSFSVLVSNRTHLELPGFYPIHRVRVVDDMDPTWALQMEATQTEDGMVTLVHIQREHANDVADATTSFGIIVETIPDATGCFNASGLGLMTQVQYAASDSYLLRGSETAEYGRALCAHQQATRCVAYYKPLKKVRDVCKLCYLVFIVAAFIVIHLLAA